MAEGGFVDVARLNKEIARQERENTALRERNRVLLAEVESLKAGRGYPRRARPHGYGYG